MSTKKGYRKKETCESRAKKGGVRLSIRENTLIYRNFEKILKVDENKSELFDLIANHLAREYGNHPKSLVVTSKENVLSNHDILLENLMPCFKEKADDRMFLHALGQSKRGFKKLLIITVDTDVVVIALYAYWDLDVKIAVGRVWDRKNSEVASNSQVCSHARGGDMQSPAILVCFNWV